jgi:hypothetical protein
MKQIVPYLFLCLVLTFGQKTHAQITTPQIKARFGVDADLRSNFFNGALQAGNDDWFTNAAGSGISVIDTTGASALIAQYNANPNSRSVPVFRNMAYPPFTIKNNKMLIDAVFIRDHHGDDSSVFSGGNKNGANPVDWTCPVSQGVPDKNDILDMYMHVRRDGVNTNDSLWFFGGLSINNTTGSRYFDFEMYQTDIVFNNATQTFSGQGPDAGHTSWIFDAAGNVIRPGDIILTAEYGSSSLSNLEARIWVHSSSLSITPSSFSWGGQFDGATAGATYGYASIMPKTAGAFYTGLQSVNNTWAGAFQVVLHDNSLATTYTARQFVEFSVNLSKLGLDPLVSLNDACALPFRRLMVKTRASVSFTAELKDFVAPFSFFRAPMADITSNFPVLCGGNAVSNLWVNNANTTSLYTWHAVSGNIVGDTIGTMITVDQPGIYVVSQQLMDSCKSTYARDTFQIIQASNCFTLNQWVGQFTVRRDRSLAQINWNSELHGPATFFELQRSEDGANFYTIGQYPTKAHGKYITTDDLKMMDRGWVYYRLKYSIPSGGNYFSQAQVLYVDVAENISLMIAPNPVTDRFKIQIKSAASTPVEISIKDQTGKLVHRQVMTATGGLNQWQLDKQKSWTPGSYIIEINMQGEILRKRIMVQ